MSSSTSNSDRSGGESRRVYRKTFLAITLGMAAAMGIIRLITHLNDVGGDTIMSRIQEAWAALPDIVAEEDNVVMVFGSSMTEAGFSPRQFDRQMKEQGIAVKSFNFGFGGVNPYFQDYLARRIREAFEAKDRRLSLAVLEFVPFQATKARYAGAVSAIDSFVTILASPEEMWDIALQDPERGALMFNIRYLRDNVSAEIITDHFGGVLRPDRPRSSLPEDEAMSERRRELGDQLNAAFEEDYPDYAGEDWSYGWQGGGTIPEERSASTLEILPQYYETLRTPRRMENDKLNRISCCDIEELEFEEELVAAYIRIVKVFQQFSDHVEVVMLPRHTEWIRYSPEAAARLAAVLDRIRDETGVTIRDDQLLPGVTPEMFRDTTHLARYFGDVFYTSHLVDVYAPLLRSVAR